MPVRRMAAVAAAAALGATVLAAVGVPAAARPTGCPAGTTTVPITWGGGNLVRWPRNATGVVLADVGGSGIYLTIAMDDPAQRNLDDSNPLADLGEANAGGPLPGWHPRVYTQTDGSHGGGSMTVGMNGLYAGEAVVLAFAFSHPVLVADLTVADLDYIGLGHSAGFEPWNSYQDRVTLTAARNGIPVGVRLHPLGGDRPVIIGNAAAGGPYLPNTGGNLDADDPMGTVRAATDEPISTLALAYSNGPDDAAAEAGPSHPPAAPLPPDADAVSDMHTIRLDAFGMCVGTGGVGGTVFSDADGDGTRDPGEPGIPGVTMHLDDPRGRIVLTTATGADGRYLFDRLPAFSWTVRTDRFTLPPGVTQTADPDGVPDGRTTVDLEPGQRVPAADFGYRPRPT